MCNLFILDPIWLSAIAAVVYAFFTGWMIWEIRKDRKLLYKPVVRADFEKGIIPYDLLFRLKNIGRGPARIVRLICYADTGVEWKLKNPLLPISLGSNESIELEFVIWVPLTRENYVSAKEATVTVEYHDILGKIYKEIILTFKFS